MICIQNCIHRKKKGNGIYCILNNEKELLMPYKMELKFGEVPDKANKYMDVRRAKKCNR